MRDSITAAGEGGRPHAMYAPSTGSAAWTWARTASATPAYTSSNASPGAPPTLPGVSAGSSCAGARQALGCAVGPAGWARGRVEHMQSAGRRGARAQRAPAEHCATGLHALIRAVRCTGLRGRVARACLGSGQEGVGSGAPLRRAGGWWLPGRARSPPACAPGRPLSAQAGAGGPCAGARGAGGGCAHDQVPHAAAHGLHAAAGGVAGARQVCAADVSRAAGVRGCAPHARRAGCAPGSAAH